ncbi:uncharacterized protein LOC108050704 isoform X2 [Drosophila rhopaloa]|uniref:Uncharacterized protein LOC108050704 isoform X2 n=1 Tax=Drosophila rhopaloa TaxID=1041015 RepID=A0A6P4FC09_DRORH|nr:uncharacterized protein LOC108050704 isoform X2 [Drosophila rhopaloa]
MIRMENVYRTGSGKNSCSSSRREILAWVNKSLDVNVERLEDLCSGAEYCRLLHKLRPSAINLKKVLMSTKAQRGFIHNMKLLQKSLLSQGVKKQIPIYRLVDGGYRENLEFAQWFKSFYDHNYLLLKDENVQEKKDGVIVLVKPRNISQMRKSSDKKEPMKKANEILENISENTNAEQHFTESDDSTESSEDSARTRREQHSCSYANGASRKPNARSRMRGSYSKQTSGTSTELSDISSVGSNDSSVGSNDSSDFTSNSEENGRRSRNSNGYSRMLEESQSDSSGHSIELESYCGCRTCEKGRKIAKQRTIPLTRFRLREFFGSGNSSPILKCSRQRVPNVFQIGAWILEVPVQQFSDRPRRKAKIFKSLFVKEAIKWKCNALKGAQMNQGPFPTTTFFK